MSTELQPIITHVAHTGSDELIFQGRRVFAELLGKATLGQVMMLGVCGYIPDADQLAVIDDIMTTMSSADPRMWPFKITRLAASYGTASYAVASTLIAAEGGMFGPNRMLSGVRWLIDLGDRDQVSDDEILKLIDQGNAGFGVTYRNRDERLEALLRQIALRGRSDLKYTKLFRRAMGLARDQRKLEAHVFLGIAAIALDAGFPVEAIGSLATIALFHDALANAIEGAAQRPAVLRSLPVETIEYRGRPARQSPRASAKE